MSDNNKYLATVEDNLLTIRPLHSGGGESWFIIVVGSSYCVFQTEQYEKDTFHIQDFDNITDAIELAITL